MEQRGEKRGDRIRSQFSSIFRPVKAGEGEKQADIRQSSTDQDKINRNEDA